MKTTLQRLALLAALSFLAAAPLAAQSGYFDVSESDRRTVFFDGFDDNRNEWWVGRDDNDLASIENGRMSWRTLGDKTAVFWQVISLDTSSDFEIEASMRFMEGRDGSLIGLVFGRANDGPKSYRFGFSGDGESYLLTRYDDDMPDGEQYVDIVPWKDDLPLVADRGEYNKLTVRKAGGRYHFFVNGELVHSMPFAAFYGPRIGFQVPPTTRVEIDYLRVSQLGGGGLASSASTISSIGEAPLPTSGPPPLTLNLRPTPPPTVPTTAAPSPAAEPGSGAASYAYALSGREPVFVDEFDDNRNGWWVGTDEADFAEIANGFMHWQKLNENAATFWRTVSIDQQRDFEIEASMRFMSGDESSGQMLVWGRAQNGDSYRLYFSGDGESYKASRYLGDNDTYDSYIPWTDDLPLVADRGQYNRLTVRKVGSTYYLFVNSKLVHSMPFEPLFGDMVGFHVAGGCTVDIDYLRIHYLGRPAQAPAEDAPPELVITQPASLRGTSVQTKSIRVAGQATDSDGVFEVMVNGLDASLAEGGRFFVDVPLAVGDNAITVVATDTRRQSTTRNLTVRREPAAAPSAEPGRPTPPPSSSGESRLALVIGNAVYLHGGSLQNPVNDARAMKQALEALGFQVMIHENLTAGRLKWAMDQFGAQLRGKEVGLFFYAGHGIQVQGNNYLVPVDANLSSENDAEYDCVQAGRILAKMEDAGSRTNIVVLDACRDNPFERSWSRSTQGRGLAFMNAPSGSLIAYATSPGNTAADGTGDNGLYTTALLRHINTPNVPVMELFQRVRTTVMDMSGGQQTPWESTSLTGNFYFKR